VRRRLEYGHCFGIECVWREHESPDNWTKDPRVKKIVERICEETAARDPLRSAGECSAVRLQQWNTQDLENHGFTGRMIAAS
jgi:hypothetical protein